MVATEFRLADNLNMNLIGAICVKLYDGFRNLLATTTAKLAHIKELTATQKQFSSAFIVQSGTYPTGGMRSSWEFGAWLPAIVTKPSMPRRYGQDWISPYAEERHSYCREILVRSTP